LIFFHKYGIIISMKTCGKCQKDFEPSKTDRHRFCLKCRTWTERRRYQKECPKCGKLMQRHSLRCKKCLNKEKHYLNTKNVMIAKNGYKVICWSGHPSADKYGKILEHRYVMENKLGRQLMPFESVHHKNGVRGDNRTENLELWVKPQPSGIKVEDAIKWAKDILKLYGVR